LSNLAISGGTPLINGAFSPYRTIGGEEIDAVVEVLKSGTLSRFIGTSTPEFYGGPKVNEFERAWENHFQVKYAISVNSWTSGLIAAVGAIGIEPGDEVILPPWTMSACAAAILAWNAIPIFADISYDNFCLDPVDVKNKITSRTRAILSVDIFGQSAPITEIMELAKNNDIMVISDAAQSPGARVADGFAGTLSHVGGFSLNYHKHIHTGEGGMIVTNDESIARRLQLIRNHAESVVKGMGITKLDNMIGFNFRMGEIEAAIGIEQLKKLDALVLKRQQAAARLRGGLETLPGLTCPQVSETNTHVYYIFGMKIDS